jgi:hypothetical protein
MDSNTLYIIAISFAVLLAGTLAWLFIKQRQQMNEAQTDSLPVNCNCRHTND